MAEPFETFRAFLGMTPGAHKWEMTPAERFTILGLLAILRPATALELGHRFGGCTRWLSAHCGSVHSVDIDPSVLESCRRFPNVTPMHMTSTEALARLAAAGKTFDFAVVDADHTTAAACADLKQTMALARVIVMHDASNPAARAGYLRALEGADVYHDLDLVDGHVQVDGLWGGLGLVVTDLTRETRSSVTARLISNFQLLQEAQARLTHAPEPAPVASKKRQRGTLYRLVTGRLFRPPV